MPQLQAFRQEKVLLLVGRSAFYSRQTSTDPVTPPAPPAAHLSRAA